MFTDLQGFTTTAEGMSPPELVAWLDRYFEAMVPAVFAHRGVVLRFFGDALLAAFGLPFPSTTEAERDRDAVAAVDCALEMQDRVAALNRELIAAGRAPVGMRVGILTGEMVAGSVGMSRRLEYTVHGDAVNSAARLESHDRGSFVPEPGRPCRILIGEPTRERLGDAYLLEAAGDLQVKGKRRALRAWRVMGRRAEDA